MGGCGRRCGCDRNEGGVKAHGRNLAERRRRLLALKKMRQQGAVVGVEEQTCPSCGRALNEDDLALNQFVCPLLRSSLCHRRSRAHQDARGRAAISRARCHACLHRPARLPRVPREARPSACHNAPGRCYCVRPCQDWRRARGYRCARHALFDGEQGAVVGEKLTRLIERAASSICRSSCSRQVAARAMQEGIISLMQMAKTSAAIQRFF